MARYKVVDRNPRFLPVIVDAQLMVGSFEYALDYLIDNELDISELHARYSNDVTGAPAYDPAVMLKIVLLAYSRGMVSSRAIERACRENVLFMAISGDSAPQFTTVAKFVRELAPQICALFTQVLMARDAQVENEDDQVINHPRIERLQSEVRRIRDFLVSHSERKSDQGTVRKSNVTDNDSAKMATAKGVIQGYTAVAAVDSQHQIIVAAQAHGSGSEQSALLPMIHRTDALRTEQAHIAADAGYHSEANLKQLHDEQIPALIADGLMRRRDERFKEQGKYKARPDPLSDKSKTAAELEAAQSTKLHAERFPPRPANQHLCLSGRQGALP